MITVFVAGDPVAQGSMTAFVVGGRAVITDQKRKALRPWREKVGIAVLDTGAYFGDRPVAVDLIFVLRRGKTVKRPYPSVKPDGDKLARAINDALTLSGCINDDAQVVDQRVRKRYGDVPGVHIEIREAGQEEGS